MNSVDFCYWLQGYFELSRSNDLTREQVKVIRDHLNLVFKHEIDPLRESETTTPKAVLDAVHVGEPYRPPQPSGFSSELIRC